MRFVSNGSSKGLGFVGAGRTTRLILGLRTDFLYALSSSRSIRTSRALA